MTPQTLGAIFITFLDGLVAIGGAALFYHDWKRPCTICEVIERDEKCWNCGKLKEAA